MLVPPPPPLLLLLLLVVVVGSALRPPLVPPTFVRGLVGAARGAKLTGLIFSPLSDRSSGSNGTTTVSGTIEPSPAESTMFWQANRALGATASCGNALMPIRPMRRTSVDRASTAQMRPPTAADP